MTPSCLVPARAAPSAMLCSSFLATKAKPRSTTSAENDTSIKRPTAEKTRTLPVFDMIRWRVPNEFFVIIHASLWFVPLEFSWQAVQAPVR